MIKFNRCDNCGLLYDPAIPVVECVICHATLYDVELR